MSSLRFDAGIAVVSSTSWLRRSAFETTRSVSCEMLFALVDSGMIGELFPVESFAESGSESALDDPVLVA